MTSIKNTGERMVPEFSQGTLEYGEHMVRYQAALSLVEKKTVLDIASGSGYGTALLATRAARVYGVDYDKDAIRYGEETFGRSNTTFLHGSATDIPLGDASVDVVVSFETLEHIEQYEVFMKEIRRVLKPDGLLILSTPNDKEFPEGAHFHIHEFTQKELEKLVKKYFSHSTSYFQATWKSNALVTEEQLKGEFTESIVTHNLAPKSAQHALYFYMLCANRPVKEKISPVAALSEHWSTREMLEHNAEIDAYIRKTIKHFNKIIRAKDVEIQSLHKTADRANEEVERLQRRLSIRATTWAKQKIRVVSRKKT